MGHPALAIVAGSLAFAGSLPATEILENGSFENNNGFDGVNSGFSWTSPNFPNEVFDVYNYTTQIWFTGPAPMGGGDWYFHTVGLGSIPDGAIVEQTQDLISAATGLTSRNIDAGGSQFTFSAQIAGYLPQTDTGLLELEFFDGSDFSLGVSATLDGSSGGDDGLIDTWDLFTESSLIPSGARKATVRILQTSAGSNGNDNYVDLVSLDVSAGSGSGLRLLEVARVDSPGGEALRLTWESRTGRSYAIDSSVDLVNWDTEVANEIVATADTTTFEEPVASLPQSGPEVYFRVRKLIPPPVLMEDFESGQGGWTTGSEGANNLSAWELGVPSSVGPSAAKSPVNCFGTNISASYEVNADIWLRSPSFDLTSAEAATLRYSQFVDIEELFDLGTVRILDAIDDSELAVIETNIDGIPANADDWIQVSKNIPSEGLGKHVKLEFRFNSDDINPQAQAGWYIDDIEVVLP